MLNSSQYLRNQRSHPCGNDEWQCEVELLRQLNDEHRSRKRRSNEQGIISL